MNEEKKETPLSWKKRILKITAGIAIGAILGYAYYYFIGCNSGGCSITSSPVNSILYGMLFGVVWTIK